MNAYQLLQHSLQYNYVHPTSVLNALIELENEQGVEGLQQFYRTLDVTRRAFQNARSPQAPLAEAWWKALHAYVYQCELWAVLEENNDSARESVTAPSQPSWKRLRWQDGHGGSEALSPMP